MHFIFSPSFNHYADFDQSAQPTKEVHYVVENTLPLNVKAPIVD